MEDSNRKNFLDSIYNDFFGTSLLSANNDFINKDLEELDKLNKQLDKDFPKISVEKKEETKVISVEERNKKFETINAAIDSLYITDASKETLKKIVLYVKKYSEGTVKSYIPFNMKIYSYTEHETKAILNILSEAFSIFGYMKNSKYMYASFYTLESGDIVKELYQNNSGIIVIKDINGLLNQENQTQEKILKQMENEILTRSNSITIITDKNKDKINEALSKNVTIHEKIFDFEIEAIIPDAQDVYNTLMEKLGKDYKTAEDFDVALLDYISVTYPKTNLNYTEYIDSLYEKILFNNTEDVISKSSIPEYSKNKSIEEIFDELNELVGLQEVKTVLHNLVDLIQFKDKAGDKIKVKDTNLHMVFLGNPGTGKTTVARMVAGILYNLNYIKQNKFLEVSAKDLVAKYVGQTAPQTMAVVEKALGGVLFIDEAYSLASTPGQDGSFNAECVATLIQAMENYRDNLVVIFAGYTKEMQYFLDSNSGIVSRIGYTINFADYTEDELIEIFKGQISKAGFTITDAAINKVREIIKEYKDTKNFGNARFVRNLYEKTVIKHASNTKDRKGIKSLRTISENDISTDNLLKM